MAKKESAKAELGPDGASAEQLSYEDARAELIEVVRSLEAGGLGLEESLTLWERGEKLAQDCQRWLDGARERLEKARESTKSD